MIFFLACTAIGFGIFATGFLFGTYIAIKGQHDYDRMVSSYENTFNDPVDIYIPVRTQPKVYDHMERADLGDGYIAQNLERMPDA